MSSTESYRPQYGVTTVISLLLHGLILLFVGSAMIGDVRYGMESGRNSIEVDLVAAPPTEETAETVPEAVDHVPAPDMQQTDFAIPEIESSQPRREMKKPEARMVRREANKTGDGSSAVPGSDATTMRSDRGADSEARPDYLRNPPPAYPERARREGRSGTVLLRVTVEADGSVSDLSVRRSSGHSDLDRAALSAVRDWKFRPRTVGGVPLRSSISVPIVFNLRN